MALNIPSRYEAQIEQLAQAEQITKEQAIDRILEVGLEHLVPHVAEQSRSYASYFGIGRGRQAAHGSPEAADLYIENLRKEW